MLKNTAKVALLLIAVVAIAYVFVRYNRVTLPEGPVPIVWDSEVCTECKMHVGDPRFAAQLQTDRGEVLNFDDPGCLFDYLQSHELAVHALYFRNHSGDEWLGEAEVGFVEVGDSPMGYGLAAVPVETPEARSFDWARARVRARTEERHGGP